MESLNYHCLLQNCRDLLQGELALLKFDEFKDFSRSALVQSRVNESAINNNICQMNVAESTERIGEGEKVQPLL